MNRPKKKHASKKGNTVSTWYHHVTGFNEACDKFNKFIPTKKEWIKYLQQHGIYEATLIADLIYKRLK